MYQLFNHSTWLILSSCACIIARLSILRCRVFKFRYAIEISLFYSRSIVWGAANCSPEHLVQSNRRFWHFANLLTAGNSFRFHHRLHRQLSTSSSAGSEFSSDSDCFANIKQLTLSLIRYRKRFFAQLWAQLCRVSFILNGFALFSASLLLLFRLWNHSQK